MPAGGFGAGQARRRSTARIRCQSLDAVTPIERLGQLRAAYRERLRTERAARRLLQTLDVLFERPILNIRQLELRWVCLSGRRSAMWKS